MAYKLEGTSQEACSCDGGCPCWAGYEANPDCGTVLSWRIDDGTVDGVDVSGRTVAVVADGRCSVTDGGAASSTLYLDPETGPRQEKALSDVWTGRLGGPVADLAALFGEVSSVQRAPISLDTEGDQATLQIGRDVRVDTAPLREAEGRRASIQESAMVSASTASLEPGTDASRRFSVVEVSFRFEA